jgi:hypothetical protein
MYCPFATSSCRKTANLGAHTSVQRAASSLLKRGNGHDEERCRPRRSFVMAYHNLTKSCACIPQTPTLLSLLSPFIEHSSFEKGQAESGTKLKYLVQ